MNGWRSDRSELERDAGPGGLNMAYACVERHLAGPNARCRAGRTAFRFLGRGGAGGDTDWRDVSYGELSLLGNRFANVLTGLGVRPGETVFTLLGRVPELYIAALGTLKSRAVFSALFASFGPQPVKSRLEAGRAKVLVTTPALYRRRIEPLGSLPASLEHVILVGAPGEDAEGGGQARTFDRLMAAASDDFEIPPTPAETPALLHFTSGTTGAPKGAVHVHEAIVAHYASARDALGLGAGDIYWCTADPGWVTGISYGLLAPLSRGATSIIDAGDFDPARWYRILSGQRVAVWYTAPTAIRMLMKAGPEIARAHDLSSLRLAASVGEPLNAEAAVWGRNVLGQPFHDTWWQTETGAIMISNPPGEEVRPGAMGRPLPGIEAAAVRRTDDGAIEPVAAIGEEGELALKRGWPSMFRGYLGNDEAYRRCFADGWYLSGDLVRRDADGWFRFVGRGDDMIKSAGHRIGPFEIESVLMEHPAVAEAGVIGRPDPVIGEAVKAFVTLKDAVRADEALRVELLAFTRRRLGPVLAPREIAFSPALPKTRSGKIVRRLLRVRELGLQEGGCGVASGDPEDRSMDNEQA